MISTPDLVPSLDVSHVDQCASVGKTLERVEKYDLKHNGRITKGNKLIIGLTTFVNSYYCVSLDKWMLTKMITM